MPRVSWPRCIAAKCRCACAGFGHARLCAAGQGTLLIIPYLLSSRERVEQGVVPRCAVAAYQPSIALERAGTELDAERSGERRAERRAKLRAAAEGQVVTARVAKRAYLRHVGTILPTNKIQDPDRPGANTGPLANDGLPRLGQRLWVEDRRREWCRASSWPAFLPDLHACHCGHLL